MKLCCFCLFDTGFVKGGRKSRLADGDSKGGVVFMSGCGEGEGRLMWS